MTSPTLLLIDIQNDYFAGGAMPLANPDAAATAAARVLATFRENRWPRVHVRQESIHPGASFLRSGTAGGQIHPLVAPTPDEVVVVKHFPDAFQATELERILIDLGARQLVVAGMMTHMCIDTTVRTAFSKGFHTRLVADATATRDLTHGGLRVSAAEVQAAFLAALDGIFADVCTSGEWSVTATA